MKRGRKRTRARVQEGDASSHRTRDRERQWGRKDRGGGQRWRLEIERNHGGWRSVVFGGGDKFLR